MKTKEEVVLMGNVMKHYLGKEWKINIHQNLGWWVSAQRGPLYVSAYKYSDGLVTYSCLMSNDGIPGTGEAYWTDQSAKAFTDPREAVKAQVECAKEFYERICNTVCYAQQILSEFKSNCCSECGTVLKDGSMIQPN